MVNECGQVMEQQSISISKAGMQTNLPARASILAAANPRSGRYDIHRTPIDNINLDQALLSRFDLLFLLLDTPDVVKDAELARHVLHVHQGGTHPKLVFETFNVEFMRAYVETVILLRTTKKRSVVVIRESQAKSYAPTVSDDVARMIQEHYVHIRNCDDDRTKEYTPPSPRTLLSIIRLSQALARIRFSNVIQPTDFHEVATAPTIFI